MNLGGKEILLSFLWQKTPDDQVVDGLDHSTPMTLKTQRKV